MPGDGAATFAALQATIVKSASWFYVLVIAVIAVMVLVLAVSRYGDIKLGPDHAEPDYGFLSWFSMLFAAGVGVGLLFYGVAEPVMHFLSPPVGEGGDMAAAADGLQLTYLHWGFNAWATYAAVAMVLAYFSYRHDLPLTLRCLKLGLQPGMLRRELRERFVRLLVWDLGRGAGRGATCGRTCARLLAACW